MYDSLASTAVSCLSYDDDDGRSTNRPTDVALRRLSADTEKYLSVGVLFPSRSTALPPFLPRRQNSILCKGQTANRVSCATQPRKLLQTGELEAIADEFIQFYDF